MTYFKLNDHDYSQYVNKLQVATIRNFKSSTNSEGNTKIQYKNSKRKVEVGFITIDADVMKNILVDLDSFVYDSTIKSHKIKISFLDPKTGVLVDSMACFAADNITDYYTIRDDQVTFKPFTLTFTEL